MTEPGNGYVIYGDKKLRVTIPLKISTNKIYAGLHYRTRMKHKADILEAFKGIKAEPFNYKVDIHMDFYLQGRTLDSSNCSYMFKMIEDVLVKCGYITNDTVKYVGKISMESHKDDYNYVEITFTERKE